MKIVENNTKSWEDNDTHSNGKDKRKRASDNGKDRDSILNARAASSVVSVRRPRSEAKSSKLLQREWKSWLVSWSDLQSNFVKHIVQSVRVDCEKSAHSASSCAWEQNSDATQYNYVKKTFSSWQDQLIHQ